MTLSRGDEVRRSGRRYMVVDPAVDLGEDDGPSTPDDLEKLVNLAADEGWELAAAVDGVFVLPSYAPHETNGGGEDRRLKTSRRTLLVMRRAREPLAAIPMHERRPHGGAGTAWIIRESARAFGFQAADVLSKKRKRWITMARHVSAYVMRRAGMSFPDIGDALGLDHTSAMHACRRVEADEFLLATAGKIVLASSAFWAVADAADATNEADAADAAEPSRDGAGAAGAVP